MRIPLTRWRGAIGSAGFIALLTLVCTAFVAQTQTSGVEAFIAQNTATAISILKDKSLSEADRRTKLEGIISSLLDLRRMALFTLGAAAKTAKPADLDAFVAAYNHFALANYTAELGGYSGQTVQVIGSRQRTPGDYIVNAVVHDPNDRSDEPVQVSFRVLDEGGGKLALVDASVEGVWFALAQRDEFAGFLGQNGGDVGKLAAHLKELAARASASGQVSR